MHTTVISSANLSYSSTLIDTPSLASDADDAKRRLTLTIRSSTYIEFTCGVIPGVWKSFFDPFVIFAKKLGMPRALIENADTLNQRLTSS